MESKAASFLNEVRKINQKDYKFWVVYKGKIVSGWEYKEDAQDFVNADPVGGKIGKIYQRVGLKKFGLDPDNNDDWGDL